MKLFFIGEKVWLQSLVRSAFLSALLVLCSVAHAADFSVTSPNDHDDGNCDNDCSLREAINFANAAPGDDRILMPSNGIFDLGSALPALSSNIAILGNGSTVDRNSAGNYSVFTVSSGATVTIGSLTLTNGGDTSISGGAINNNGTLTLNNCILSGNNAGNGGAINTSGTLTLNNCTLSNNTGTAGGAIENNGTLIVNNSTFNGNTTTSYGGAIFNDSMATLTNCTLTDNQAATGGGALSDNTGDETFVLSHCTIAGNRSLTAGSGGGLDFFSTTSATLSHTILAGNTANGALSNYNSTSGPPPLHSNGYNLSDDAPSGLTGSGDLINNANINLGALADNGGPTQTLALLSGSAAINAGDPTFAPPPSTDQRGFLRVSGGRIDIGAFELDTAQSGPTFVVNVTTDNDDGACTENNCSLREAINAANAHAGTDTISIPLTDTITLGGALPDITGSVTIQGAVSGTTMNAADLSACNAAAAACASPATTVDAGGLSRHFVVAPSITVILSKLRLINGHNAANGGSISNNGTLTVNNCTLSGNSSDFNGGAISNNTTLTVNSSTFNGNTSTHYGGAIFNANVVTLNSSTLTDNQAALGGGALSDNNGSETFVLSHCTIAGNRSLSAGEGGGFNFYNTTSATLNHTILAGNTANGALLNYGTNSSTLPPLHSNGYNLSDDAPSGLTGSGDIVNSTTVNLGALGDNGGLTQTIALLSGSAAINAGDPAFAPPPSTDQRGTGYSRVQGGRIDIGAFEAAALSINNVAVVEGDSGTANAAFTVTLSSVSTQTITVNFATADGTATAGSDYNSRSGTLLFTPGQTTKTVTVGVKGDTLDENNETFFVNLSNANISKASGTCTILDNDPTAVLTINDITFAEGTGPVTNASFTVTLSPASGRNVTVNYTSADGTAHAPDDYNSRSGTLLFTPGQTTKTITIGVKNDNVVEDNEFFKVNLSGASGAILGDNQGVCTILDNDAAGISINDVTIVENDSGLKNLKFTLSLSTPSSKTVTVDYATADGSATAGSDYVQTSGTVTFSIGQTIKTFIVQSTGDLLDEDNETFFVNLSNPVVGVINDGQGIGTINDNDPAPLLSINDIRVAEGNGGTGNVAFTVTLSAVSARTVTVNFATVDGSATAGSDYNARSGSVTFAPGQTSKTITVGIKGDTVSESDETFKVNLSGAVNANIADNQGVCTITNDDGVLQLFQDDEPSQNGASSQNGEPSQ